MNIKEAFDVIGLPKTASEDELKAKYKSLAKQYHPDIYKEDPEKFKKINEAYQLIEDYRSNPSKYDPPNPFRRAPFDDFGGFDINFNDIFGGHPNPFVNTVEQPRTFQHQPLNVRVNLSFKESVIGCEKEIQFNKFIKCDKCNGRGKELLKNGCNSCDGFGKVTSSSKGMIFTRICGKCNGRNNTVPCVKCNSIGINNIESNIKIHIPPGTINNSTLRLKGAGHYVGPSAFGDVHMDVFVSVNVEEEQGLTLEGANVVAKIDVSLLDALTGCSREVKTIYDTRTVHIPAGSKNKDEIALSGCGVPTVGGVQRVILNVEYPSDINSLIKYLKKKEN